MTTHTVYLRMSDTLHSALTALAQRDGQDLQGYLVWVLGMHAVEETAEVAAKGTGDAMRVALGGE